MTDFTEIKVLLHKLQIKFWLLFFFKKMKVGFFNFFKNLLMILKMIGQDRSKSNYNLSKKMSGVDPPASMKRKEKKNTFRKKTLLK